MNESSTLEGDASFVTSYAMVEVLPLLVVAWRTGRVVRHNPRARSGMNDAFLHVAAKY